MNNFVGNKFLKYILVILASIILLTACKYQKQQKPYLQENVNSALPQLLNAKLTCCFENEDQPITLNSEFTEVRHFFSRYPKTTVLRSYNGSGYLGLMHAKLDNAFENRLPPAIIKELQKHDLYQKNAVDLFFAAQANWFKKDDYVRLLPHNWADPDMPQIFPGDRLHRDFLAGLYEAPETLAAEVPVGSLAPLEVWVHLSAFSPKVGQINIEPNKTYAFYSLVIGEVDPSREKRANVTLHWLLDKKDKASFNNIVKREFYGCVGKKSGNALHV